MVDESPESGARSKQHQQHQQARALPRTSRFCVDEQPAHRGEAGHDAPAARCGSRVVWTGTIAVPESVFLLAHHWRNARTIFERRLHRASFGLAVEGEPAARLARPIPTATSLSFGKEAVVVQSPRTLDGAAGGYLAMLGRSHQLFCNIFRESELVMAQQRLALAMLLVPLGSPGQAHLIGSSIVMRAVACAHQRLGDGDELPAELAADLSAEVAVAPGKIMGSPAPSCESSDGSEC